MALSAELVLVIAFVAMFFGGVALLILMGIIYKLLINRLARKADAPEEGGLDLGKAIEQVNKARVSDAKEIKERLSALEAKVELLAKPHSKEREVEMEKAFAKSGSKK